MTLFTAAVVGEPFQLPNCTCRIAHDDMNLFNAITIIGVLPVLASIGLASNMVNTWVYQRGTTSAERYLMALSLSDFGVCASGILVIAADSLRAHNFYIDQIFVILLPKLIPFGLFFQMTSIYVTVAAAVDCYVAVCRPCVCFPNKFRRYCSIENANKILTFVIISTALYNIIQFGELEAVRCYSVAMDIPLYELCPTAMRLNMEYITIYRGYMYTISMAFFPFAALSVLTVLIMCEMHRRKDSVAHEVQVETYKEFTEIPEDSVHDAGSPVVLVLVVVLNLGCSFISLLVNVCDMFEGALTHDVQMALIDIGNLLVVFNATANFIIYAATSPTYRSRVKQLFCVPSRLPTKTPV
ncbi:unnamed protein product [Bursaphelenchus okinawaensis]|uniref:G-protein coupled receptors family 1 profile domain-containing protein n=1 Tax=Bursaphelenchus okinawaensis TaxID=465554 RepID=A0A811L262_9BILA|nr:unnamed protein product [Bursaphelenchus okinawaensis]CAG9114774.1 unnamed protein product [Bursaphelenchus okinawaensis]